MLLLSAKRVAGDKQLAHTVATRRGLALGRCKVGCGHNTLVPTATGEGIEHGAHTVFRNVGKGIGNEKLAPVVQRRCAAVRLRGGGLALRHQAHAPFGKAALGNRLVNQLDHIAVPPVLLDLLVEREDGRVVPL